MQFIQIIESLGWDGWIIFQELECNVSIISRSNEEIRLNYVAFVDASCKKNQRGAKEMPS
jgi:hypothetical protein